MPRENRRTTNTKLARNRRAFALERNEFRQASEPRAPTASPTSFPIKAEDPAIRKMIDDEIARRDRIDEEIARQRLIEFDDEQTRRSST